MIYLARVIKAKDAGYTLLELLVVLAIISMVIAVSPKLYGQFVPKYQVRQFANDLANFARQAREKARQEQVITGFEYSEAAKILVSLDGELAIPSQVEIIYQPAVPWNSVAANKIEFYPSGASSGGRFDISRDDIEVEVSINWVSGAVEVKQ